MSEEKSLPFESFSFTLLENKRPRVSFRLIAAEDEMYELRVQKGSASNPSMQFTRSVPLSVAQRLRAQGAAVYHTTMPTKAKRSWSKR